MAETDINELTARIVAAFVANNTVAPADLPALIHSVRDALSGAVDQRAPRPPSPPPKPAVPIKRSVKPDHIVCLEDGRHLKSLKRYLRTQYNLTPEQYRERWSLPHDYPMVAPNYSKTRSAMAKQMGLGTRKREPTER